MAEPLSQLLKEVGLVRAFVTIHHVVAQVEAVGASDAQWTGPVQVERLTKPGSTYRNLDPYEVSIQCLCVLLCLTDSPSGAADQL